MRSAPKQGPRLNIFYTIPSPLSRGNFGKNTVFTVTLRLSLLCLKRDLKIYTKRQQEIWKFLLTLTKKYVIIYSRKGNTRRQAERSVRGLSKSSERRKGPMARWTFKYARTLWAYQSEGCRKGVIPNGSIIHSEDLNLNRKEGDTHGNWRTCLLCVCGIARRLPLR